MINISDIIYDSIVDGFGIRAVIFFQGCNHKCLNCHNPQTHSTNINKLMSIYEIVIELERNTHFKKVSISGGEPFLQYNELLVLVKSIQDYNIWIYTGYTYDQLVYLKYDEIFNYIDVLVDGLYDESLKSLDLAFRGSSNQNIIHFKKRKKVG